MLINPFSNMNGHVFQSANAYKEIGFTPAFGDGVYNQHQEICTKPISGKVRP